MKDVILDYIKTVLENYDYWINSVVTVLTEDFFQNGNEWYDFGMTVAGVIKPAALSIVGMCFFIEFLKITINANILKWEWMFKCFFKLCFAKVCIDISYEVLSAIYATAASWISKISTSGGSIGVDTYKMIKPELDSYGTMAMIGVAVTCAIMFIAIMFIAIIIKVIAYARKFEIILYLSISPLPCAFLPLEDGGSSRIPKKFFMTFAGVCVQGLFIIISIKLYEVLCTTEITDAIASGGSMFTVMSQMLLASLVLLMAVFKSSTWAKNILDAM